jgi:hypothetical protein
VADDLSASEPSHIRNFVLIRRTIVDDYHVRLAQTLKEYFEVAGSIEHRDDHVGCELRAHPLRYRG